jgi:ParB family chromosome partitioning protein
MARWSVFPEGDEPVHAVTALAEQVERDGGRALAIYRDPVGEHWQIFCLLPLDKVEPTPYQRDLSPTHTKRLQEVVKKIDRFVDPIVVMSPRPGLYWTPNGNHRRAVLAKLKAEMIPAILVPEPEVAFQILALNTEKAHNLREKSLRRPLHVPLFAEKSRRRGGRLRVSVQSPRFITLGILYEAHCALRGQGLRPDPAPRRQVPEGHFPGALKARGAPSSLRAADIASLVGSQD